MAGTQVKSQGRGDEELDLPCQGVRLCPAATEWFQDVKQRYMIIGLYVCGDYVHTACTFLKASFSTALEGESDQGKEGMGS